MNDNPNSDKRFAPVVSLAVIVWHAIKRAKAANAPAGRQEQLETLAHRLARIRSFETSNAPKRIGVFGAPKRGKSTLLNALIGYELLPTGPIPLTTTTIEIVRDTAPSGWQVTVHLANKRIDHQSIASERAVANQLEQFGTRKGSAAERLRVSGSFPHCRILDEGGVLLDTPGAEVAFEPDSSLREETKRALKALTDTHVVLFCARADQLGSRSDFEFYEKHIRPLAPIHVITCKDKWSEKNPGDLMDEAMKQYAVPESNVVLVSAQEAVTARATGATEAELGPSGLLDLEKHILKELKRLTPEDGLLPCIKEFKLVIQEDPALRPERIYFENLRDDLREGGETCKESLDAIEGDKKFWKLI